MKKIGTYFKHNFWWILIIIAATIFFLSPKFDMLVDNFDMYLEQFLFVAGIIVGAILFVFFLINNPDHDEELEKENRDITEYFDEINKTHKKDN